MNDSPPRPGSLLEDAVHNNVLWCDTMVRLHGARTELTEDLWTSRGVLVPYYPKLITRTPSTSFQLVLDALDKDPDQHFGLKDSYAVFPSNDKLRLLFESTWIGLEGNNMARDSSLAWSIVSTPDDLDNWACDWADAGGAAPELAVSLFIEELLTAPGVTALKADGAGFTAGALLYEHSGCTGLSNVFPSENPGVWTSLVSFLNERGAVKLVGYENGDSLAAAEEAGFHRLGPLRVWLRA